MTDRALGQAEFQEFALAMQAGDTVRLRRLTDPAFTLTHITGYVQPVQEWLAQMRQGQFVYHSVGLRDLSATTDGDSAKLVALTRTDARVYGSRHDWPLRLAMDYARRDGRWIALRAIASLWR